MSKHGGAGGSPAKEKKKRGELARKAKSVFMSVVLVASQVLGMVGGALTAETAAASDALGTVALASATPVRDGSKTFEYYLSNGSRVWCGDVNVEHAEPGTVGTIYDGAEAAWHNTYAEGHQEVAYTAAQMHAVDYLIYHAENDIASSGSAFGMYGTFASGCSKASAVVQITLWLLRYYPEFPDVTTDGLWTYLYAGDGDGHTSDVYWEDCVWRAYSEAKAYADAGGGDPAIDGCARVVKFGGGSQDMFFYAAPRGSLKLRKVSADSSVTDGNSCYSLEGAVYGVYSDAGCSAQVGTLTTGADGSTGSLTGLTPGTYWVKETRASAGYRLCEEAHQVTVTAGREAEVTCEEPVAMDPVFMAVGKYDGQREYRGEANLPEGSASLAGAEFTVEYYDTLSYGSYDELRAAGESPTRSWVLATDADGFARLSEDYLVSGDSLYYGVAGTPQLPRGTVVIRETKAPEGYKVNSDFVSFQKIQENVTTSAAVTFNAPEVAEQVVSGGVSVSKIDHERDGSQGDATLAGAEVTVYNASENSVVVGGVERAPGEAVATITTDASGAASTGPRDLPYGTYTLRETRADDAGPQRVESPRIRT